MNDLVEKAIEFVDVHFPINKWPSSKESLDILKKRKS